MGIKTGVSLYSYQENFFLGKLDLEGCIAEAAKAGAEGIELIPEQMCWQEYLAPSDAFAEQWKGWMEKYKVKSAVMDVFFDYILFANRVLTKKEQIAMYENNIQFAAKLGFPIVRAMMSTNLNLLEDMWRVAADYGVKFGIEVHAPATLKSPYFQKLMERMDKTGTKNGGIIPDMSIFSVRPPKVQMDKQIRAGADPELVDLIVSEYIKKTPITEVSDMLRSKGAREIDLATLKMAYASISSNPEELRLGKGKIIHVHGKIYEMDENCEETAIDYAGGIRVLKDIGYDGYIATEYEGQRNFHDLAMGDFEVDEAEQVRRSQIMMKKYIGA
jgi:sugar phosphate isomerase/epimerase